MREAHKTHFRSQREETTRTTTAETARKSQGRGLEGRTLHRVLSYQRQKESRSTKARIYHDVGGAIVVSELRRPQDCIFATTVELNTQFQRIVL